MTQRPRLSVVGTGYLGVTHAVCMAELGYEVIGLDVDADKIALLRKGIVPFYEPDLPDLLEKHSGRALRFTTDYAEIAQFADIHFVCVGTPQMPGQYAADLRYVESAFASLAPHLARRRWSSGSRRCPPVRQCGWRSWCATALRPPDAEVAWNPEFLREGFAVADTLRPGPAGIRSRLRVGRGLTAAAFAPVIEPGTPVVVTDFATAELVKVAANSFLATKISFINAMAEVCEATGADVTQLADAIGYDPRIGRRFLAPGSGFGGGCLPKDIRAFIARASELGVDQAVSFLREVDEINLRRRARTVEIGLDLVGGPLPGIRVAVLGAAFKPDSDDIRDSPALDVAAAIGRHGAEVVVYDPHAMDNARRLHPELDYAVSLDSAVDGADLVLLLTEWAEFRAMDPVEIGRIVRHRNIVDGRNVLDPALWRAAGWHYRALGRP